MLTSHHEIEEQVHAQRNSSCRKPQGYVAVGPCSSKSWPFPRHPYILIITAPDRPNRVLLARTVRLEPLDATIVLLEVTCDILINMSTFRWCLMLTWLGVHGLKQRLRWAYTLFSIRLKAAMYWKFSNAFVYENLLISCA